MHYELRLYIKLMQNDFSVFRKWKLKWSLLTLQNDFSVFHKWKLKWSLFTFRLTPDQIPSRFNHRDITHPPWPPAATVFHLKPCQLLRRAHLCVHSWLPTLTHRKHISDSSQTHLWPVPVKSGLLCNITAARGHKREPISVICGNLR